MSVALWPVKIRLMSSVSSVMIMLGLSDETVIKSDRIDGILPQGLLMLTLGRLAVVPGPFQGG
jgi:hypothetical protein